MQTGVCMKRDNSHRTLSFPVLFHALADVEMESFSNVIGCTADALKAATKTALWHHHLNAEIASEAIGKRPVILHLGIELPRDAGVYYSIEPDGALVRGYSWTADEDWDDGGYFLCDYRMPEAREDDGGNRAAVVPKCVAASLANILAHFLPDEAKDFQNVEGGECRRRHIFNDLRRIDEWLIHIAGTDVIA